MILKQFAASSLLMVLMASSISPAVASSADEVAVGNTLDALHRAAAEANGEKYFSLFAENAVYFGLSAGQRWPMAQFRPYAQRRFDSGTGWTYTPQERHITVAADGRTAWFDEILKSQSYGITLGTGVLVKQQQDWKITQYNLTLQIPAATLPQVAHQIMEDSPHQTAPRAVK